MADVRVSLTCADYARVMPLATGEVTARGRLHVPVSRAQVKLRYRSPAATAEVVSAGTGFRLVLDEPAYGVAEGQAAVLYEDDAVVGAGLITSSE